MCEGARSLTEQLLYSRRDLDRLVLAEPVADAVKVDGYEPLVVHVWHRIIHAQLFNHTSGAVLPLLKTQNRQTC